MNYTDIIQSLKEGKYAPVYLLQGEEPFFIDSITNFIAEHALNEAQKRFNRHVFYGKDVDFNQILTIARTFSMMGERQVVIIKEAQELKGWNKESNQTLMINYLKRPHPGTILVFGYKYKTLDKRTKIAKAFKENAIVLDSKKVYDNQIPAWIAQYTKAGNIRINNKAVALLSENIGNNLQRLSNEIEKLMLNLPKDSPIDERSVHQFIGISKEYNVFELQSALSSGNQLKAQQIVRFFASNPTNHPMVLTIFHLFSYFNKLLIVHSSPKKDNKTLAGAIGVHPFFVKEYIGAIRLYSLPVVLRNIQLIHEADLISKGINQLVPSEGDLLKELIFKLMNQPL